MTDRKKRSQRRRAAKREEVEAGVQLSNAQRRYLRTLRAHPGFRGAGGRQPQTRDALLRKGYIEHRDGRDVILLVFRRGRWRWP